MYDAPLTAERVPAAYGGVAVDASAVAVAVASVLGVNALWLDLVITARAPRRRRRRGQSEAAAANRAGGGVAKAKQSSAEATTVYGNKLNWLTFKNPRARRTKVTPAAAKTVHTRIATSARISERRQ